MPIRSALLLDFDNIFGGLHALDPHVAIQFAEKPTEWLNRLAAEHLPAEQASRRWLVLRCYMNTSGFLQVSPTERLHFSKYRPFLVRAGFDLVDCPALTARNKNAADIKLVIDALDLLAETTSYDEFVIASSDSDFAPLLRRLRASDRLITLVTSGATAPAYRALADKQIDDQDLADLVNGNTAGSSSLAASQPADTVVTPPVVLVTAAEPQAPDVRSRFEQLIREAYEQAEEPLNLAQLSSKVREALGVAAGDAQWFGASSFLGAVANLRLPNVQVSQHHLWDGTRHVAPEVREQTELPTVIRRLTAVVDLPRIESALWSAVFHTMAEYAATQEFNLTEATRWPRDTLAHRGVDIGRGVFVYALRSCRDAGVDLRAKPSPTAGEIRQGVLNSIRQRCIAAGLDLSAEDMAVIEAWLSPDPPSPTTGAPTVPDDYER